MTSSRRIGFTVCTSLALLGAPAAATAAWHQPAGGPSPINAAPGQANESTIAPVGGVPYVAWAENDSGHYDLRVSRLNAAGTGWEQVGGGTLNEDATKDALENSLVDFGGVPYVAWEEFDGTNQEIRVKRLNQAGTAWEDVVPGASPVNESDAQDSDEPSLAVIGGALYVAWEEQNGTNYVLRVSRLNQAGTAWQQVVGGASPINHTADKDAQTPGLTSVGGVPYVVWNESDGTNFQVRVSRLNAAGTAWEEVVGGASPINESSTRSGTDTAIATIGGVPYVAWRESDGTNDEVRVSRLNQAGTAWEQVVGGPSPVNQSSTRNGSNPTLAAFGGVPYVAWTEVDGTGDEVRVSRLDPAGTAWEQVVGGPSPINDAAGFDARRASLASVGGVPYVSWSEAAPPHGSLSELRVSRLEPELSEPQAVPTETGATLSAKARTFGVAYPIAFEYGPGADLSNRTAIVQTAGTDETETVSAVVAGLTPGTLYSQRAAGFDGAHAIGPGTTTQFATLGGGSGANPPPGLGPQPPVTGPAKLLVKLAKKKLKARVGRRVALAYTASAPGSATLQVFKGRKRVARVKAKARAGRNKIVWNGKAGSRKAKPGRYSLRLAVTGAGGQTASARATLTLVRR